MAIALGRTRYGIAVSYSNTQEQETTSKTYNGINFGVGSADGRAIQTTYFVRGGTTEGVTYVGLAGLLSEAYLIDDIDVTARNQVTGTAGE